LWATNIPPFSTAKKTIPIQLFILLQKQIDDSALVEVFLSREFSHEFGDARVRDKSAD
jgi:hypothetical protein